jgi:hypothetical protein
MVYGFWRGGIQAKAIAFDLEIGSTIPMLIRAPHPNATSMYLLNGLPAIDHLRKAKLRR